MVSSGIIDRVTKGLGRRLLEVPVGFKWFVDGLLDGSLGFGGEESAGASFLRIDGTTWTTDKDGIIPRPARGGDHGDAWHRSWSTLRRADPRARSAGVRTHRRARDARTEAAAPQLSPDQIDAKELAGEPIRSILTTAPGNGESIGGLKVMTDDGWFAVRPSGTEDVYKLYAESFRDRPHLEQIQAEAQAIVARLFA